MLSKESRLRTAEVKEIINKGKNARATILGARFVSHEGGFRCAVVVSKKISKSAVVRNKIRRSVYDAIRLLSPQFNLKVVFFVQKLPPLNLRETISNDIILICSKHFS